MPVTAPEAGVHVHAGHLVAVRVTAIAVTMPVAIAVPVTPVMAQVAADEPAEPALLPTGLHDVAGLDTLRVKMNARHGVRRVRLVRDDGKRDRDSGGGQCGLGDILGVFSWWSFFSGQSQLRRLNASETAGL